MKEQKVRGFEVVNSAYIKVQMTEDEVKLPMRGDAGSAGYDFFSNETITLNVGGKHLFWTNVKAYMQQNELLEIHIRSSLGVKYGLVLSNGTGIIDSSYYGNPENDGNIGISITNRGEAPVLVKKGDRIAQGIFKQYLLADEDQVLHASRTGGFGSTKR
ncbi:dUTP diphosphatase [Pradoshia sp. D12]|uniref:dUTP diphosphatase n=1 Tax=Bacillaceae TaxID=186817 RepID=UPI00080ADA80|nr:MULTISPECIES: dUTP diphosphatase [Bacillaceae]OCA86639.1 dUTPase [Bacillus sp. FJAT-27986]QFK71587.1 dUTP diphosphatase [Pradoshia sp. D12]TPF73382.1 dUTP diphosphatase [Bacillus sp. D12]